MPTYLNSDSALNTGTAVSESGQLKSSSVSNPFVVHSAVDIWRIFTNPWNVTTATSGTTTVNYNGTGSFIMTVNYNTVSPTSGVSGFPFIRYGGDIFNTTPILGQGSLVFPVKVSSMTSLIVYINYTLSNTAAPANQDIGFDQWLIPTANYSGGIPGAFEIFIAPYFNFGGAGSGGGATFIENANYPINGSAFTWSFFSWGSGAGQEQIFCPNGNTQITSGESRFDILPMINRAIAVAGGGTVTTDWYLANMDFGTEWGGTASPNFTVTTTKLDYEQSFPGGVVCSNLTIAVS